MDDIRVSIHVFYMDYYLCSESAELVWFTWCSWWNVTNLGTWEGHWTRGVDSRCTWKTIQVILQSYFKFTGQSVNFCMWPLCLNTFYHFQNAVFYLHFQPPGFFSYFHPGDLLLDSPVCCTPVIYLVYWRWQRCFLYMWSVQILSHGKKHGRSAQHLVGPSRFLEKMWTWAHRSGAAGPE